MDELYGKLDKLMAVGSVNQARDLYMHAVFEGTYDLSQEELNEVHQRILNKYSVSL